MVAVRVLEARVFGRGGSSPPWGTYMDGSELLDAQRALKTRATWLKSGDGSTPLPSAEQSRDCCIGKESKRRMGSWITLKVKADTPPANTPFSHWYNWTTHNPPKVKLQVRLLYVGQTIVAQGEC